LSKEWKVSDLISFGSFISLDGIIDQMDLILEGKTKGRVVVEF